MKRIPKLTHTQIYRFWLNVDKSRGQRSCWLWKGHIKNSGYGVISINTIELKVHRVSYFLAHGRIDDSLMMLHTCDVRRCVNPAHLYQGTAQDNATDMSRRGHVAKLCGEANGKAKLTRQQVKSIKKLLKDKADGRCDLYLYQIAQLYGVSPATISYLKNGGRWDHVPLD